MRRTQSAYLREDAALSAIRDWARYRPDLILFRNNVGLAKYGSSQVAYGLLKGSADLIGIHARVITEADVGHLAGVFMSVEVKSMTGTPTPEQLRWARMVRQYGGVAMTARSPAQVESALEHVPLPLPRR